MKDKEIEQIIDITNNRYNNRGSKQRMNRYKLWKLIEFSPVAIFLILALAFVFALDFYAGLLLLGILLTAILLSWFVFWWIEYCLNKQEEALEKRFENR